jgi:acyl transferase
MSVSDLFMPANYLVHNGFRVTRFDSRDAVGRSDGSIINYRLSTLRQDAALIADTVAATGRPVILVALSLSATVTWALAGQVPVAGVATLVPAVDIPRTIDRVIGPVVTPYRNGAVGLPTMQTIFGHDVRAGQFVQDMDDEGHTDVNATCALVANLDAPSLIVAAADDEYVDLKEVHSVIRAGRGRVQLTVVQGSSHEIGRSVVATRQAMARIAQFCLAACGAPETARQPRIAEVISASEAENQALRGFPSTGGGETSAHGVGATHD